MFCSNMWSSFENVPHVLEKKVYSLLSGCGGIHAHLLCTYIFTHSLLSMDFVSEFAYLQKFISNSKINSCGNWGHLWACAHAGWWEIWVAPHGHCLLIWNSWQSTFLFQLSYRKQMSFSVSHFFTFLCFLLAFSLFKMAPKHSAEDLVNLVLVLLPSNLLILCLIESNSHLLTGLAHNSLQISVLFSHASHLDQVNSCFVKTLKLFKLLWKYDIQKAMSAWSVVPSGSLALTSLLWG